MVVNVVTDGAGCVGRDTNYVNIYDTAAPTLVSQNPTCFGFGNGQVQANIVGGAIPYSSDLSGLGVMPGASPLWTGLGAGTFVITVSDNNGCISNQSINLINPAAVSFDTIVTSATCGLNNGIAVGFGATGGTPPYSFSFGGGPFSGTTTYNGLAPGSYQFIMKDGNGCADTIDVTINSVGFLPLIPSLAGPYIYCFGDSIGPITATGTVGLGTFSWYVDDTLAPAIATTSMPNVTLASIASGSHTIYVIHTITATGCDSYSGSATLEYWPPNYTLSPEYWVCPYESVQFNGVPNMGAFAWDNVSGELNNGAVPDPIATPTSDTTYYSFVYTSGGSCLYNGGVSVYWDTTGCANLPPDIANAFSPDGDGVNDIWIINGIANTLNNRVVIFNRWGDVVNEFQGYNNADVVWEGKNQSGYDLPVGTYFYIIELLDSNVSRSGWIQLTK